MVKRVGDSFVWFSPFLNYRDMLYDLTELKIYSNGDKEFEADMFQTFLNQTSEFLSKIEYYLLQNNMVEIGRIAHKFKSSVSIFGMAAIRQNLDFIEDACRKNADKDHIEKIYNALKVQIMQVVPQIKAEKKLCLK